MGSSHPQSGSRPPLGIGASTTPFFWRGLNESLPLPSRRFTRLTNAFSKQLENHVHAVALRSVWYNVCWRHTTLRTSPAQATGIVDELYNAAWLVGMVDDLTPAPKKPRPKPAWGTGRADGSCRSTL